MSNSQRTLLGPEQVSEQVLAGSRLWSAVTVVAQTGSTNEDLVAAARDGAAEGSVLVAEQQTRGRGRLGRQWVSEPAAALTFSVLLRPVAVPAAARGWLPLLAGVAVAAGIHRHTGLEVGLKWPNDVLGGMRAEPGPGAGRSAGKLAGILAEQAGNAIVVGTGLNVTGSPQDLPSAATSLAELGADADRAVLLAAILREFEHWYLRWISQARPGNAIACGLRAEYLRWCTTIGRDVRVELPGGTALSGRADDVDELGRLLVAGQGGAQAISAGDVVHVR